MGRTGIMSVGAALMKNCPYAASGNFDSAMAYKCEPELCMAWVSGELSNLGYCKLIFPELSREALRLCEEELKKGAEAPS